MHPTRNHATHCVPHKCYAPHTYHTATRARASASARLRFAAMRQALSILEDETAFVQRKSRRGHMRGPRLVQISSFRPKPCCAVPCTVVLRSPVRCCAVLYSTALY